MGEIATANRTAVTGNTTRQFEGKELVHGHPPAGRGVPKHVEGHARVRPEFLQIQHAARSYIRRHPFQ